IAPLRPVLADHLWRNLVAEACEGAPASVHLAGWPEVPAPDRGAQDEMAEVREVVELGRQVRAGTIRQRQPLRRAWVAGSTAAAGYLDVIGDELNVREVELGGTPPIQFSYKPNLRLLAPRL